MTIVNRESDPPNSSLNSLAPHYEERQHKLYLTRILDAIANPEVRNIAVAGAYGTGKSSVLQQVARELGDRVVSVSLSSVGILASQGAPGDANPANTLTNRIQKEIVKQLLYQAAVGNTPESRFRRMTPFRWDRATVLPAIAASLAAAGGFLGFAWSATLGGWAAQIVNSVLIALAVAAATLAILGLIRRGSLSITSVTAGPATVALSKNSTSFFDDYLDEIVYRFLANHWDVVIFEDIDRFEDVEIFESLRSLNTLLNGAVQNQPDRTPLAAIRFVYALRDSVFERLGRSSDAALPVPDDGPSMPGGEARFDATVAELVRANRTKFFDIVVPMVPFITYRNARELMKLELEATGVSDALIDLAAKHVAEMRLIKNSRNELDVFSEHLLSAGNPLPGLTADRLYALILYKSFHMAEFEKIRTGQSALDTVFRAGRTLISASIARLQDRRSALHDGVIAEERAKGIGDHLRRVLDALRLTQTSGGDIDSPDFWRESAQLMYRERSGNQYSIDREGLSKMLNLDLDSSRWEVATAEARDRELKKIEEDLLTLSHATWADLFARPDFTSEDGESFARLCKSLGSRLAIELVQHGFITEYFALDVAPVYGQMVDPHTYNYMIHFVDRGEADLHYPLTFDGVQAILRDYGRDVLRDRSMQNLTVMDYLLSQSPEAARTMTEDLLATSDSGQHFFANYLQSGADKAKLVELLAPRWNKTYSLLVQLAQHSALSDAALPLLDKALMLGSQDIEYELSSELREWIESHYQHLACFVGDAAAMQDVNGAMAIADRAGVRFADVKLLSDSAREAATRCCLYLITPHNLSILVGSADVTLDSLSEAPDVFEYVVRNLADYLLATTTLPAGGLVVRSRGTLVKTLANLSDLAALDELLTRTGPEVVVSDLTEVPSQSWPMLVAALRATASLSNIASYRTEYGIDASLGLLLESTREIRDVSGAEQTERASLAEDLVRARAELPDPDLRVRLAKSLDPGQLDPRVIAAETGPLGGLLLGEGLLPDGIETFTQPSMSDWATFAAALHRSGRFEEFMTPTLVPSSHLARLLSDKLAPRSVRQSLADQLDTYFAGADEDELADVLQTISEQHYALPAEQLQYLASRGAKAEDLLEILSASDIDPNGLRTLLSAMPAPYGLLASPLTDPVRLPDDHGHQALVERLKASGLVRSRRGWGHISVYPST